MAGMSLVAHDVVSLFEGLLGREPSAAEVDGLLVWSGGAGAEALVAMILSSDEYAERRAALIAAADPGATGPDPHVLGWAQAFPPSQRPWDAEYVERHRGLVSAAIEDAGLTRAIGAGGALPSGYAVGYDERTIEYPWLFGRGPAGRVLDAGSTLNFPHILDQALRLVDALTILTLAPEEQAFPLRGVSYVYGDLRELPFRDGWFDMVVSLSTLEHVGCDNTVYGAAESAATDPDAEVGRAARELRRVTRPGGRILLSVPFGRAEDHGWFRQFDGAGLERLIEAFDGREHTISTFAYGRAGWRAVAPAEAVDLSYRTDAAEPPPASDLAAAARAVACVEIAL
jgi:SAM-dependent methyltransferase